MTNFAAILSLTHVKDSMHNVPFLFPLKTSENPLKQEKLKRFLTFSEVIEMENWAKMG